MTVGIAAGAVVVCVGAIVAVICKCRGGGASTETASGPGLDWTGEPGTETAMMERTMDTTMGPGMEAVTYAGEIVPLAQLNDMSEGIALAGEFL
jgi:hypothetical protein